MLKRQHKFIVEVETSFPVNDRTARQAFERAFLGAPRYGSHPEFLRVTTKDIQKFKAGIISEAKASAKI